MAKKCEVSTSGPIPWGPLRDVGAKRLTCSRLLAKNTSTNVLQSIDDQMRLFLDTLVRPRGEDRLTTYRGEMMDCLFAMLYILRHFPQLCMPIGKDLLLTQGLGNVKWAHFSVFWHWSLLRQKYVLLFPGVDFEQQITDCLRSSRFFIILLILESKHDWKQQSRILHANALCYDRQTGVLERFDPYQGQVEQFNTTRLDRVLEKRFAPWLPGFREFVGPPDVSVAVRQGLQRKAERELQRQAGDPVQFCLSWAMLYIEMRLRFPDTNPEAIPELLQLWVRDKQSSLTHVVRGITKELEDLKRDVMAQLLLRNKTASQDDMYLTVLDQLQTLAQQR